MAIITVYDLLEVSENASKDEIEKSYLRLVNEYKIDPKFSQQEIDENEMILKKLKLAYDILSNDEKRKKYDADLAQKRAEELIKNVSIKPSTSESENANQENTVKESVEPAPNNEIKYKKVNKEVVYEEEYDEEPEEIQLTDSEKKNLKKAAEKEFKDNLKKAQKAEEEYNKAYNEAYNDYLRKMGYTVKEPWTLKRVRNLIIGLLVIIVVCVLIWILPPTRKLLVQIYEENFIIKSLVDIVVMLFNAIISAFK